LADQDEERFARNQNLIARMAAPSTTSQILAYLDEELEELIRVAVRMNEGSMIRRLHEARRELNQVKRGEDPKKSG
jgi:hypothetical protein